MKKTKLAIIGTAGIPSNYGGFETLAEHITEELQEDLDITVYCSAKKYKKQNRKSKHNGARLVYLPLNANGIQSIIYDSISIIHAIFRADVLLVLGVSAGFLLPLVRSLTGKKIITSIDGLEWKRNKWNKWVRWFLWASEWCAVKASHASIADNESIQDYTAMRYGRLSNIIEYGADHASNEPATAADHLKYPFLDKEYAVKVCRIEPENNVHVVLDAFSRMPSRQLVVVGNWNNSAYGTTLRGKYKHFANLHMLDPIYNQREIDMLRSNAAMYIHGHSAGGTNPSLVEAMHLDLPVIAYGVKYNRTTTENSALYFKNADDLVTIVRGTGKRELSALGAEMHAIAERRYKWQVIASKYSFLIAAVAERSHRSSLQPYSNGIAPTRMADMGIAHLSSPAFFYEKR